MSDINQRNPSDLSRDKNDPPVKVNERKVFVLVGLIGVVALFLGFIQLKQQIKSPFTPEDVALSNTTLLTNEQLGEINNLKTVDTDKDGLSDYDELYLYNTSPYLKDSDSDGISDKEEITNGTDPNCPVGQDCTGSSDTNSSNLNSSAAGQNNANAGILAGNLSADTLRETLKNAGVPQNILDSTSDEDLLAVYNQTISETQNANTNSNNLNSSQISNINSSNSSLTLNANLSSADASNLLSSLTPQEIRDLLVQVGLSESDLNSVDDATLQAIFLQALQEQQTGVTNANTNQ